MRMADTTATALIVRLIMQLYDLPREVALVILGFLPVRRRLTVQKQPYWDNWIRATGLFRYPREDGTSGSSWGYFQ